MNITVQTREKTGTSAAKEIRVKGMIPGEVYGHDFPNVHVAVSAKEFNKVLKAAGETTVITLGIEKETMPVLIYDVSRDPLTDAVRHVDFYRVRMDEKITAKVPIEFIGESRAVKAGGVLVKAVHEIEVEALPGDMPHTFTADLSCIMEIGGSLQVKDVMVAGKAPVASIIKSAPDMVIATVIAPRAEEEAPVAVSTMEDVKVETEEKKAEREKANAEEKTSASSSS